MRKKMTLPLYILNIIFLIGLFYFLTQAEAVRKRTCALALSSSLGTVSTIFCHLWGRMHWERSAGALARCLYLLTMYTNIIHPWGRQHCAPSADALVHGNDFPICAHKYCPPVRAHVRFRSASACVKIMTLPLLYHQSYFFKSDFLIFLRRLKS